MAIKLQRWAARCGSILGHIAKGEVVGRCRQAGEQCELQAAAAKPYASLQATQMMLHSPLVHCMTCGLNEPDLRW